MNVHICVNVYHKFRETYDKGKWARCEQCALNGIEYCGPKSGLSCRFSVMWGEMVNSI